MVTANTLIGLLLLVCLAAGALDAYAFNNQQAKRSSATSYCGCSAPFDSDYVDPTCCVGHISSHMGDFGPFRFNTSVSYAAYGQARTIMRDVDPEQQPSPTFESVIIVDVENQIMFQSGAGGSGIGSWFFTNGSYLTMELPTGGTLCLYSNGTYEDELKLYAQSMWLAHTLDARSNIEMPGIPRNPFICQLAQQECASNQVDVYVGLTRDVVSCEQKIYALYAMDHDTGFVRWASTEFPSAPGGQRTLAGITFNFFDYQPIYTPGVNWTFVPPLPASCAAPIPLCPFMYPNGPFSP